jgi:hypothetical protein
MARPHLFVVEQYVPQLDRAAAASIAQRLDDASARMREDGVPVHWISAIALPREESLLCFLDAENEGQVLQASEYAGVAPGHVQEAIAVEPARL